MNVEADGDNSGGDGLMVTWMSPSSTAPLMPLPPSASGPLKEVDAKVQQRTEKRCEPEAG